MTGIDNGANDIAICAVPLAFLFRFLARVDLGGCTFADSSMVFQQKPGYYSGYECCEGREVDAAGRDPRVVYVCFMCMDLGGAVVAGGHGGGRFVIAFDEVLGGVRDDVKPHKKEKDGHCETGKYFCTLKTVEHC